MNPDQPSACQARAPFKAVQGKHGVKFRQAPPPGQTGPVLELEHTGHDHVVLDVRERYRLASGGIGSRHQVLLALNSHQAVELAGLLFHFVDRHLRNDAEAPFHHIVTTPERAACGPNWLIEDQETAIERLGRRRSRSHVLGLMQRFLEVCEGESFVKEVCMNLALWANRSGDAFAVAKAEQALYQMAMVPDTVGN